jgi:hypothetical protein
VDGRVRGSRIAHVPRVVNTVTRKQLLHTEYRRLFNKLRQSIKKRLAHTTFVPFPNHPEEEVKSPGMTDRAAQAHEAGEMLFYNRPGRRAPPTR